MDAKLQSGIDWKDIPEQDRNKILNEIIDFLEKYPNDEYFAAKALWHLAKLGVVWAKLPFTFRNKLERHIVSIKVLGRNISQALCGFRLMRSKWRDINSDTQRVFINTLIKHFEYLDEIDVCNIVYSLGKMEVKWKNLPQTLKVSTLTAIGRSTYRMNDFGISNTIWALGHCGVNWEKDISHHLRMSLFERILEVSPLSPNSLSSTLGGFSRMNLQWKALPLSFRLAVQTVFEADENEGEISALPSSGERTVSSIIYSLGRLHADQTSLSLSSQDTMMKSISAVSSHLTMQGISNVLYGLALMKWKWADIPTVTRNDLIATIMKALPNMDDRPLSNIVWSLGQLEATWSDEVTQQSSSSPSNSNINRKNLHSLRDTSGLLLNEEYIDPDLDGFGNYEYFESKLNNNNNNNNNNSSSSSNGNTLAGDEEYYSTTLDGSSSSSSSYNYNKESELSPQLFSRLMDAIERVAPSLHDQGISQLMVGFVKMGCSWTVIPKQIKELMNQRALILGGELGYYSISACLWCLRVEGLLWPSEEVEKKIITDNSNLFHRLSTSGKYKMAYSNSNNNSKYTLKDPLTVPSFIPPSDVESVIGSSSTPGGPPNPSSTTSSNTITNINTNTNSDHALRIPTTTTTSSTTTTSTPSSAFSSHSIPSPANFLDLSTTTTEISDTTTSSSSSSSASSQLPSSSSSSSSSANSPSYTNEEQFLFILMRSLELSINKQPVTPLYSMSVILNSLSSMGASWSRLSPPLRSVILNSILSNDCHSNPTGVACYIYFLAKIGFIWDDSNISKKKQIFTIIEHTMHKMSERLFSSLILGLSMLGEGFGSKSTSPGIKAAVFENIIRVQSTMKPQAVIAVLKALSKQKDILWFGLPVELREALNTAIIRVLRTEARKNQIYLAVDIIGCLGKLGVTISDISDEMRKYLFGALLRPVATNESTMSEFALALTGLAKLEVVFSELPETLQILINQQLLLALPFFDCSEIENCIWSLSKMKLSWDNLSSDIRNKIEIALESKFLLFSHSEFTWTLWALGKMSLRWDDCSIKLKKSILKSMQEILPTFENHELGTVLLTFEKLQFPLNNFPLRLRNEIFFGIESVANVIS